MLEVLGTSSEGGTGERDGDDNRDTVTHRCMGLE